MSSPDDAAIGRFDKSFLIHMIRDFFLVLVAVTAVEFAVKAAMVFWNFRTNGEEQAAAVAADLAENVRSIMLNEGGPVAARTVYPILERNWDDLGYEIAIMPSEVTVRSIEAGFGFSPVGIPPGDWPDGAYREASVGIVAQEFCLSCHSEAEVGDELGRITVRNYLARDFALWVEDIRVTAALSVGKIVLHSILLFLILRARMEPLLRLRAVVGRLARAYGGLHHRAEVRTADEFGALARDLNLFLDRIGRVIGELDGILGKVVAVNDDIVRVQGELRGRIDAVVSGMRALERRAMLSAKREPRLSEEWFAAMRRSVAGLAGALESLPEGAAAGDVVAELRAVIGNAEAQLSGSEAMFEALGAVGTDADRLTGAMAEMTRLEERMKSIIESAALLLQRLRPPEGSGGAEAGASGGTAGKG